MTTDFDTLDGTLAAVWTRLEAGVSDKSAPARHIVLSTIGARGAEARIVVLRGADRAANTVTLFTDKASSKCAELDANPNASLLVWDAEAQFQIRLRVAITTAPGAQAIWARLPEAARATYGGAPRPGQPIPDPAAYQPAPDQARFWTLTCHITEIETLHLGQPHKRANFCEGAQSWLAP